MAVSNSNVKAEEGQGVGWSGPSADGRRLFFSRIFVTGRFPLKEGHFWIVRILIRSEATYRKGCHKMSGSKRHDERDEAEV